MSMKTGNEPKHTNSECTAGSDDAVETEPEGLQKKSKANKRRYLRRYQWLWPSRWRVLSVGARDVVAAAAAYQLSLDGW